MVPEALNGHTKQKKVANSGNFLQNHDIQY
jgi:hypothetical protein